MIAAGDGTPEPCWLAWLRLARLPTVSIDDLIAPTSRAVVVAPHPDDEILAAGGLLTRLARLGRPICLVAVTDGEASHPGSSIWTPRRLADERPQETLNALRVLGVTAVPVRLAFPDGQLANQKLLAERVRELLQPTDTVFTTWRKDGHPDHEAAGEATAQAARACGARLVEIPVWAWHWAAPGQNPLPWSRAKYLLLDPPEIEHKQRALQAFTSQRTADESTGQEAVLRSTLLQRAARPFEVMFT